MKPALSSLTEMSQLRGTFQINSGATDFFISIMFINELGQSRSVVKTEFNSLTFESNYKSPFVVGSLKLFEGRGDAYGPQPSPFFGSGFEQEYESISTGGEFIHIKIDQQSYKTRCNRVTIVDQMYITKTSEQSTEQNEKIVTFYFADVQYGALMYQKFPWSTNDYLDWGGHDQLRVSQLSAEQKALKVSDAIKHLLQNFCGRGEMYTHGIEDSSVQPIINEKEWDGSASKIEYTLPKGVAPMVGLNDLMSYYISENNNDMGILYYHNGQYSLRSLKNVITDATTQAGNQGELAYGNKFAGVIKIETDDIRTQYSSKESHSIFKLPDEKGLLIPVHITNTSFHKKQPNSSTNKIVDHSIVSYSINNGLFKINNKQGSIDSVDNSFTGYIKAWPDVKLKKGNFEKSDLTAPNSKTYFTFHTRDGMDEFIGKKILQQRILDTSDKSTLNIPVGNLEMTGGKFIGIEVGGLKQNAFMNNVPGFWFVLRNLTVLKEGQYSTQLVCSKLDRFDRKIGTRAAGPS